MNESRACALSLLAFTFVAFAVVACSDDDAAKSPVDAETPVDAPKPAETATSPGAPSFACDNRPADGTCADFGAEFERNDAAGACDGTLLETGCPRDGVVGRCTVTTPRGTLTNNYYGGGRWTAESAETACASAKGTFTT